MYQGKKLTSCGREQRGWLAIFFSCVFFGCGDDHWRDRLKHLQYAIIFLFLQLCRAVCGGCFVEAVSRKSLKHTASFVTAPPTRVGVAGSIMEAIIQAHFLFSADQLFKRWSSIRSLMRLAHPGDLGDPHHFSTHTLPSMLAPRAALYALCSRSVACLQFALMRTACEHPTDSSEVAASRQRG